MKVGMIFECGPQGPDRKVCEHLALRIKPNLDITSITLDNKRNLVSECGKAAAQLLKDGCERVVIIWDLSPAWGEGNPCRHDDREGIFRALAASKVDAEKVALVCIQEELEAWLLADERALNTVLSRPTHPISIKRIRRPEQEHNPKKRMTQIFRENSRRPYNDLLDAEKIAKAMPDFARLRRCDTFVRFARKVADTDL